MTNAFIELAGLTNKRVGVVDPSGLRPVTFGSPNCAGCNKSVWDISAMI